MKNQLILFCCLLASCLSAQQLSNYSLYREQLNVQNPAAFSREYFFEENNIIVGLNHRQQWVGVEDAPTNTSFSAELVDAEALPVVGGIGIWGVHDRTGKLGFTTFAANFKGGIPLSGRKQRYGYMQHFLSLGFSLGWAQYYFKASEIRWKDADDEVALNEERSGYFDVTLGLFLYGRKQGRYSNLRGYYFGASAPQIFEPDPDFSIKDKAILKRKRHYFAFGGIRLKTYGEETYFEPSVYFRYVENTPMGVDANLRWKFNEFMWAGLGGGTSSAHFETGVEMADNQLKINFGYDFTWRLLYGHSAEISLFWTMRQ